MTHLRAEEWEVGGVSHAEAVRVIERWHYSMTAPNTGQCFGLWRSDTDELLGASLWLPPTPNAARSVAGEAWRGVLHLSRLVVAPDMPTNAASFLLGRSMRLLDRERWPVLLTYADTALGHTGAIYHATNWDCLGETPAGDVWIGPDGERRGRKRGRFNYSAEQMREMGFERAPSLPKIKFVHRLCAS